MLRLTVWRVPFYLARCLPSESLRVCTEGPRKMSSEALSRDAKVVYGAAIASVSPPALIQRALNFDPVHWLLTVQDTEYQLNHNVKVVAFGKAILGMASALEAVIGEHIAEGVASVPVGTMEAAQGNFPQYLPRENSRIRICEGAAGNLPDAAAELAAREILDLAKRAIEGDLLIALISGGGSALLPCPPPGVTLQEKRQVVELLARAGASIHELNTFRKAISLTKGGKLAEAAFPAKLLALILSDVIGDPLDIIASGPTVPNEATPTDALRLSHKYNLTEKLPPSVVAHLEAGGDLTSNSSTPLGSRGFSHAQNVVIGSNCIATEAAMVAAQGLEYRSFVWSHRLQGEAKILGEIFAKISNAYVKHLSRKVVCDNSETLRGELMGLLQLEPLSTLISSVPELRADFQALFEQLVGVKPPLCLISGGETTVTVRGKGKGGRNQELALSFALHSQQRHLEGAPSDERSEKRSCLFLSVGTDGQDGPCDAAGAVVDAETKESSVGQGLDLVEYLDDNDSYSFFSRLNGGRQLIQTGLTGTNVMDLQLLMIK